MHFLNILLNKLNKLLMLTGLSTGSSKGDVVKEAHFALLSLLLEAARLDVSSDSLHSFLESQANWPANRCKKLTGAFTEALPQIQALLSNVGFHPPHVVDVKWCLNHNIKVILSQHLIMCYVSPFKSNMCIFLVLCLVQQ